MRVVAYTYASMFGTSAKDMGRGWEVSIRDERCNNSAKTS